MFTVATDGTVTASRSVLTCKFTSRVIAVAANGTATVVPVNRYMPVVVLVTD